LVIPLFPLRNNVDSTPKGHARTVYLSSERLLKNSNEQNKKLYFLFIDFENVFDPICRESLWDVIRFYGLPERIIKMITP